MEVLYFEGQPKDYKIGERGNMSRRRMSFIERLSKKAHRYGSSLIEIEMRQDDWSDKNLNEIACFLRDNNYDLCSHVSYKRRGKVIHVTPTYTPKFNERALKDGTTWYHLLDELDTIGYKNEEGRDWARFFFNIVTNTWVVTDYYNEKILGTIKPIKQCV